MDKKVRFLAGAIQDADATTRSITAILSNEDVCLDRHVVITAGIDTVEYMEGNPVVPFAHQTDQPPVARMTSITKRGALMIGTMEFADAETYGFADTIYRLVKNRFLNATSISWMPLKWEFAKDRRPDGINFIESRLLETSIVPVPANPAALVTARSFGIDTRPLVEWAERTLDSGGKILVPREEIERLRREAMEPTSMKTKPATPAWKVTASRNLPVSTDGDAIDVVDAVNITDPKLIRKAFLVCSEDGATKRFAIASMRDGRLTVNAAAVRAVSKSIDASDLPDEVKAEARSVLEHYTGKVQDAQEQRAASPIRKRGLHEVGWLASMLCDLAWLEEWVEWEAEQEGDGSPVPAELAAVLKALVEVFKKMAIEEADELVAEEVGETMRALRALRPEQRAHILDLARKVADGKQVIVRIDDAETSLSRAGKVFSAANVTALEDVHAAIDTARCNLRALIDGATASRDDEGGDDGMRAAPDDGVERRKRAAAAARARHQFETVDQESAS